MMLDQSDDKSALKSQSENRSVAIIGSGLIGSSWAIVFRGQVGPSGCLIPTKTCWIKPNL